MEMGRVDLLCIQHLHTPMLSDRQVTETYSSSTMCSTPSPDQRSQHSPEVTAPSNEWCVEIKLTHVDCNPADILVHFQGQYVSTCELDYNILRVEIQNAEKVRGPVDVGNLCLVEDDLTGRWYRGRVQNKQRDLFDVFLIDHGNVLSVCDNYLACASDELLTLPPKIVCGFFANVLPADECWTPQTGKYFSSLIGCFINGCIHALLPHKVVILEAPEITKDLSRLRFGRPTDTGTFLLLVEMLTEVSISPDCEQIPDLLSENQIAKGQSFKPLCIQGVENILSCCGPRQTVGEKVKVRLSAAVNPSAFYCQKLCVEEELKVMSEKLAFLCESKKENIRDRPEGNLGLLCAVRGKDEKWHRGYVQFLPVNSQVRVLFVDYGYCELVKVEDVYPLPSDFLMKPIMTFPCALSSLNQDTEALKKEQHDLLLKGLLGSALSVKINDFDKEQNFYLVTLCNAEDDSVVKTDVTPDIVAQTGKVHDHNMSLNYIPLRCTNETRIIPSSILKEDFEVGAVFEGYVEHVLSPVNFWIRTAKRNQDFEHLMNTLADYISTLIQKEDILENPVPGTLCLAMYEKDLHYYRAIVTDTLENGAEVFFTDFGNTEKVPNWLIKKLPERFTTEPEFVVNCSLAHVLPLEDVWTDTATEHFRHTVSNKALEIHVIHKTNERFIVELYEIGTQKNESIALHMTAEKMALNWKYKPTVVSSASVVKDLKKCKTKTLKPKSTVRTQGILTNEKVSTDEEKGENENLYGGIKNMPEKLKIQRFKPGEELNVRCCNFESPSDFWCQIENQISSLNKLMEDMQVFYQTHEEPLRSNEVFCAVKLAEDGRWYRGCLLSRKLIQCKVALVDYGLVVMEQVTNLRTLSSEFNQLEVQSFRCSLYNLIEPTDGNSWSNGANLALKEFVSESVSLKCTIHAELYVMNVGLCNVVDLHTTSQQATTFLVKKGLVVKIQPPKKMIPKVYPVSFMYSSFSITFGGKEQVYATHVASPWEIYCQLGQNGGVIEDLMEKVAKESDKAIRSDSPVHLGSLCLAKYPEDEKWYRGISKPVLSNQLLSVFFVDYGNRQIVEKSDVKPLEHSETDLLMTPMQALKCSLRNIPKGEPLAEVNDWLENNILNKPIQAIFVAKDSDGTFICDMFDGDTDITEKIREVIAAHEEKEKGLITDHINADGRLPQNSRRVKAKPSNVDHNTRSPRKPEIKKVIKTVDAKAYNRPGKTTTPKKMAENKTSVHKRQDPKQFVQPQSCVTVLPKLASLPDVKVKPGFKGIGFVSHVDSINSFFIQMQENESDILKMGEDLNGLPFKEKAENITSEVHNGDLVAAEFEEDGAVYRAVVADDSKEGHLAIEFIDYGNVATVDQRKVQRLTNEFISQPRLSIPCSLVKTHTLVNNSSFEAVVKDKPLEVEFIRHTGTHWEVNMDVKESKLPTTSENMDVKESKLPTTSENGAEMRKEVIPAFNPWKFEGGITHKQHTKTRGLNERRRMQERSPFIKQPYSGRATLRKRKKHGQKSQTKGFINPTALNVNPPDLVSETSMSLGTHFTERAPTLLEFVPLKNPFCVSKEPCCIPPVEERAEVPQQIARGGLTEEVTLLTVLENGELYIRLNGSAAQLTALETLIDEVEPECQFVPVQDVKEGLKCLTKSHGNDQWRRAVVRRTWIEQKQCSVQFLDYGSTELIPMGSIKTLRDDVGQMPEQAIHCRWNGCGEPITVLKEILSPLAGQTIKLMFVSYVEALQLWSVEIFMNELLIWQQRTQSEYHAEEKESHVVSDVCLSLRRESTNEQEKQPRKLFMDPVTMGLEYSGFVAAVTNPGEFYIALDDQDHNVITTAVSDTLESLPDLPSPLPDSHLIPGTGCLIRHKDTRNWCRAEILHVDSASVVMNLVDYGVCTHILPENGSQLKILPAELARLPKIIYPCLLRGIKPAEDEQWSDRAVLFFQEVICHKNLQIYFRQCILETQWEVDILTDGISLAKALVDSGHALYIDCMLGLRFEQEHSQNLRSSPEKFTGEITELMSEGADLMVDPEESEKDASITNSMDKPPETNTGVKQCVLQ